MKPPFPSVSRTFHEVRNDPFSYPNRGADVQHYDQMKVVAHKHIGVDLNLVDPDRCCQFIDEDRAVPVVERKAFTVPAGTGDARRFVLRWFRNPKKLAVKRWVTFQRSYV